MSYSKKYLEKILFVSVCIICTVSVRKFILGDGIVLVIPLLKICLPQEQSLQIYYFLFIMNLLMFLGAKGRGENIYNLGLLVLFPMQLFIIMLYSNYLVKIFWFALVAFLLVLIDEIGCYIRRNHFLKRKRRRFRRRWSARWSFGRVHFRAGIILCMVCCYASLAFSGEVSPWTVEEFCGIFGQTQLSGCEFDQNEFEKLKEENFAYLSEQEKIDVLQAVLNQELSYLGCESVQLIGREFSDSSIYGYYNHGKKIVAINVDLLDWSAEECVRVCLHEAYHAYQHVCVDSLSPKQEKSNLKMFEEVSEWKYEFEHYRSASGDSVWWEYAEYLNQEVEKSARSYAEMEWEKYFYESGGSL